MDHHSKGYAMKKESDHCGRFPFSLYSGLGQKGSRECFSGFHR